MFSKHLSFLRNTALLSGRLLLALLLISTFGLVGNAYGHSMPISGQEPIRIDEQFSDLNIRTDETIIIVGSIRNASDRSYELSPSVYITPIGRNPFDSWLDSVYGNRADWYFDVEHDMPDPLILGSGEMSSYEISIHPLKQGTYHVHSYVKSAQGESFMTRGYTITATGSQATTEGEIREFYLPVAGGLAIIAVLAVMAKRRLGRTNPA